MMRYNDEQIPTDAIRIIVNRTTFKKLPSIIAIDGEGQNGKSTDLFYIINRTEQIFKYGTDWRKHKNEWDLWDYKKFATKDIDSFCALYENYDNVSIALEEASEQGMDTYSFFAMFSKAFSTIARTQGCKLNRVYIITPFLNDLLKMHKRKFNLLLWASKKDLYNKVNVIVPRKVKVDFLTLKEDNIKMRYVKNCTLRFDDNFLKYANEYTNWLKEYKKDILKNTINEIRKSRERQKFKEELQKEPIISEKFKVKGLGELF